jgi:carbon monoxide dehydrogenase subunit G
MEIEQSFTVGYPLDDVWTSFHDTPGIVACLPGATLTAPPENGALKLAMTVKLGPIVASFAGDGEMTLDENDRRGSVSGGGGDRKSASRVKGVAAFALHAISPAETRVEVKVDYTIAGTLAQFSRGGIVKELATRLTDAFAQNLKTKLDVQQHAGARNEAPDVIAPSPAAVEPAETGNALSAATPTNTETCTMQAADTPNASEASATSASASSNRAAVQPAGPPASVPLDLGNLFWKMLWSRIRGWLRPNVRSR